MPGVQSEKCLGLIRVNLHSSVLSPELQLQSTSDSICFIAFSLPMLDESVQQVCIRYASIRVGGDLLSLR